jgi:hypothetical protein
VKKPEFSPTMSKIWHGEDFSQGFSHGRALVKPLVAETAWSLCPFCTPWNVKMWKIFLKTPPERHSGYL